MNKKIIQLTENNIDRILDKFERDFDLSENIEFKFQAKEFFYKFKASEVYRIHSTKNQDIKLDDFSLLGLAVAISVSAYENISEYDFITDLCNQLIKKIGNNNNSNFISDLISLLYSIKIYSRDAESIYHIEGEKDNE